MSCSCTEMSAWWLLIVKETCSKRHIIEYNIVVFWLNDILVIVKQFRMIGRNGMTQNFWTYHRSYSTNNTVEGNINFAAQNTIHIENSNWRTKKYIFFCTSIVYNLKSYFPMSLYCIYILVQNKISLKKT